MKQDRKKWTNGLKFKFSLFGFRENPGLVDSLVGWLAAHWPGLLLCIGLGIGGQLIGRALPLLGSGTSAILLGILVGNAFNLGNSYRPGIRFCESKVLEFAVACMGFSLSLQLLTNLHWTVGVAIISAVFVALIVALVLSQLTQGSKSIVMLIGVGTAICGSSAIVAAAPLIAKERKDIGIAVGVVSLLGVIGIFLLPVWSSLLGFDVDKTGILIGGSLQAVAHVVAAGFSLNDDIGNLAVTVKMGRVAMLIPLIMYLTITQKAPNPSQEKSKKIPWYLIAFLLAVTITSLGLLPDPVLGKIKFFDKFLLTLAMAAIGLSIHFKSLREQASKALSYGIIIWFFQIGVVSLIAMS